MSKKNHAKRGKFIVFYGINNLGKSTQAKLLVEKLNRSGHSTEYLKYPIYDLEPSGPMLNDYLRKGNPHDFSAREIQMLYILNRTQYQSKIISKLDSGINVVAEDYIGTGLAWGIGSGVDRVLLTRMNNHLLPEDIVFLFQGDRFLDAKEENHAFETNDLLIDKVRLIHDELGRNFGWVTIDANRQIEIIHEEIFEQVIPHV